MVIWGTCGRKTDAMNVAGMLARVLVCGAAVLGWRTSYGETTVNATNRWAWGPSLGWINCRPDVTNGAAFGEYVCSGFFYSPTWGWIHLGNGMPTNGIRYSNAATNDYGVNHDGKGNLRGFAWAPTIGWILFEDVGAPHIDLVSGCVTGAAWSVTQGWITFTNVYYFLQSDWLDTGPDADRDGIPDAWERDMTGSTNLSLLNRDSDGDGDGVRDFEEYRSGTDPMDSSSFLRIQDVTLVSTAHLRLTWSSVPTRIYALEESGQLVPDASWADSGLGWFVSDTPTHTSRTLPIPMSSSQAFHRVKAAIPLSP